MENEENKELEENIPITEEEQSYVHHSYKKVHQNYYQKQKNVAKEFLLDHSKLKTSLDWTYLVLATLISALSFAYGYRSFTAPEGGKWLVSGGISGISQMILRICQLCGYNGPEKTFTSITYYAINFPLFFVSYKYIGKKFTFLSVLNVSASALLIQFLPAEWCNIFSTISGDFVARALFAGVLTGISSGLAYFIGSSTGGADIITFSIAEKKGTTVGKYTIIMNFTTVFLYTIFNGIRLHQIGGDGFSEVYLSLYTLIYFFTSSKVMDLINIKNKKVEVEINTTNKELAQILLRVFPHGLTIVNAVGGYTGKKREILKMVVSQSEVKEVVKICRKVDEGCFVEVKPSITIFGRFYTKPMD